jgi:hypothetical protein
MKLKKLINKVHKKAYQYLLIRGFISVGQEELVSVTISPVNNYYYISVSYTDPKDNTEKLLKGHEYNETIIRSDKKLSKALNKMFMELNLLLNLMLR